MLQEPNKETPISFRQTFLITRKGAFTCVIKNIYESVLIYYKYFTQPSAMRQPRLSPHDRLNAFTSSLASQPNALLGRAVSPIHRPQHNTDEPTDNVSVYTCHYRYLTDMLSQQIPLPPITPSAPDSTTPRASLRYLPKWLRGHAGHSTPPPIVDIPFAQGEQVHSFDIYYVIETSCINLQRVAAGARKGDGGYIRDEDYVPPPPPLPDFNHGRRCAWLCW